MSERKKALEAKANALKTNEVALQRKTNLINADWRKFDDFMEMYEVVRTNLIEREKALVQQHQSFKQEKNAFDNEKQRPRALRLQDLLWEAPEDELLSVLHTATLRLVVRGSPSYVLDEAARLIDRLRSAKVQTPLAGRDILHEPVVYPFLTNEYARQPPPRSPQAEEMPIQPPKEETGPVKGESILPTGSGSAHRTIADLLPPFVRSTTPAPTRVPLAMLSKQAIMDAIPSSGISVMDFVRAVPHPADKKRDFVALVKEVARLDKARGLLFLK